MIAMEEFSKWTLSPGRTGNCTGSKSWYVPLIPILKGGPFGPNGQSCTVPGEVC